MLYSPKTFSRFPVTPCKFLVTPCRFPVTRPNRISGHIHRISGGTGNEEKTTFSGYILGLFSRPLLGHLGGGPALFLIVFEHCIQCDIFAPRCSLSHVPVCRVSCFQADMLEPCFPPQSMFARTTLLFPLVRWSMIFIFSGNLPVQKKENYMRKLFRLVCQ